MAVILGNPIMLGGGGGSQSELKKISTLSEGDVVRIKEKGVEQDYYLAQHDYQPSLNGSGRVLFVRKNIHSLRAWDDATNAYATSDIDTWLNGEFKSMFDADVREAMGETTFPYTVGNGNTTVSTLQRSVFLLSCSELAVTGSNFNTEGTALPIADRLKIAYLNATATAQYTRTPLTSNTSWVLTVNESGAASAVGAPNAYGIRPAITLHNSCTVLPEPNTDGSYTLSLGDDNPEEQLFKLTVVDGTEKPENPADNTIWVNTDIDIGMCYLAPNAPTNPQVGDVWVNTTNKYNSNGTNASTNLIRVNDNPYLEINVLNISQWDGSVWSIKENSGIYANGEWTIMALYIFNYGTLNEQFPLKAGTSHYSNAALDSYKTSIKYGTDYFSFTGGIYDDGGDVGRSMTAICMSETPINLSKFNKLRLVVKSSQVNVTVKAGYVTTTNPILQSGITTLVSTKSTSAVTIEADISSYTNTVYPALSVSGYNSSSKPNTGTMTVYFWCFTA